MPHGEDGLDLYAQTEPREPQAPEQSMHPSDGAPTWDTGEVDPIQIEFLQAIAFWEGVR